MTEKTQTSTGQNFTNAPSQKPIPAATLVIFRDQSEGIAPDILMVERSAKMAFAAGAAVFPGGRIDDADYDFARALGHDDVDEYAARIAAIRESIEETGILVGVDGDSAAHLRSQARAALHEGTALAEICTQFDWKLELEKLVPFARWCPPFAHARVFDTRFYLISDDDHKAEATVDETENYNLFWSSAQGVLDQAEEGKVKIIFPTKKNLERLALFNSFEETAEHSRNHPIVLVAPVVEKRDGEDYLCIPEGIGYPNPIELLRDVTRGIKINP